MKKQLGPGFAAMALIAALAGCAGSPGTSTTTAAPTPSATSPAAKSAAPTATTTSAAGADAGKLKTASSGAGNIVVDAKGMSLYFFTKDVKDSGTSACTDKCLIAWPPALTTAATPSAEGVTGTLGTITTPAGAKQLTLNGMPLYYYQKDTKAGDVTGQGVGGVWYLSDPAGEMIKAAG